MCKPTIHIKFCTCSGNEQNPIEQEIAAYKSIHKGEEYLETYFTWRLARVIGKRVENEIVLGSIINPAKYLTKEITAKFIVEQLNLGAKFDFDYQAEEGDELCIREKYKYVRVKDSPRPYLTKYMTFVYEKEEWYFGYVDYMDYKTEKIFEGKLKKQ